MIIFRVIFWSKNRIEIGPKIGSKSRVIFIKINLTLFFRGLKGNFLIFCDLGIISWFLRFFIIGAKNRIEIKNLSPEKVLQKVPFSPRFLKFSLQSCEGNFPFSCYIENFLNFPLLKFLRIKYPQGLSAVCILLNVKYLFDYF